MNESPKPASVQQIADIVSRAILDTAKQRRALGEALVRAVANRAVLTEGDLDRRSVGR